MTERFQRRARQRVGPWTLVEELGHGGNSEVWVAEDAEGRRVALKILHVRNPGREPYRRSQDEVRVHRSLTGDPGVLPLIEANLPERPGRDDPAWLATEIAEPLSSALADVPLEDVVRAMASIAETLARLHEQDIHHRDVKPANLFRHARTPVVGDLGLVSDPDKEPITEAGGKLGPMWFLAPEMLTDPAAADGAPADVYSLAKSLWVLATGAKYPPQGQQRTDTAQVRITDYVGHPRAYLLDRLVERATSHVPSDRPTMAAMAAELTAWGREPREPVQASIEDIAARLHSVTAAAMSEDRMRRDAMEAAGRLYNRLLEVFRPYEERLRRAGIPARFQSDHTFLGGAFLVRGTVTGGPELLGSDGAAVIAGVGDGGPTLWVGFGYKAFASAEVDVAAGYLMGHHDFPQEQGWLEIVTVPAGSAQEENLPNAIAVGLEENLREALERFASLLEPPAPPTG
jgi:hypothetical protein